MSSETTNKKIYKNIKYERQAVLTAIKDEKKLDKLVKKLNKQCFTDDLALKTFSWIKKKYNKDNKLSILKLDDETDVDVETLTDVGIRDLEYDSLLNVLMKLYKRRKLFKAGKKIADMTKNTELDIDEMDNQAQDIIFEITSTQQQKDRIYDMEDILNMFFEERSRIEDGQNPISGINTGFATLDSKILGFHSGHLTTIAAPTHFGKTSLALQIILNMIKQEYHAALFSLEMEAVEIARKLIALDSQVPTSDYQQKISDVQRKNMNASLERLMDLYLTVSDKRNLSPTDIKAKCRMISREKEIDIIFIDYLQNMKYSPGENTEKQIGQTCLDLRNLAGELNVPIVLISQMNRNAAGKPSMAHLRGSGRIEEISDEVIIINRPNKDIDNNFDAEEAKVIIEKGRTTGGGILTMFFYPEIQAWRDKYAETIEIIKQK